MTCQSFPVPAIMVGADSQITIKYGQSVLDAMPLATGRLVADFKYKTSDVAALFALDSDIDPLVFTRIPLVADPDGAVYSLTLNIAAAKTVLITQSIVMFDLICYDGLIKRYVPGLWSWPARKPVTVRP